MNQEDQTILYSLLCTTARNPARLYRAYHAGRIDKFAVELGLSMYRYSPFWDFGDNHRQYADVAALKQEFAGVPLEDYARHRPDPNVQWMRDVKRYAKFSDDRLAEFLACSNEDEVEKLALQYTDRPATLGGFWAD